MTYLQIMYKALDYFIKEPINNELFDYWQIKYDDFEKSVKDSKERAKLNQVYLFLTELNRENLISDQALSCLNRLEEIMTNKISSNISLFRKAREMFQNNSDYINWKYLISEDTSVLDGEMLKFQMEFNNYLETKIYNDALEYGKTEEFILSMPINEIIYNTNLVLSELFFTESGYKYFGEEYKIKNPDLRKKCYYYVKEGIIDSLNIRHDCDLQDEHSMYYSMFLINSVLYLATNNKEKELDRLINLDHTDAMQFEGYTVVDIIYDQSNIETYNLYNDALSLNETKYLLFFLGNDSLIKDLSDEEVTKIMMYYFNARSSKNQIEMIKNDYDKITNILNEELHSDDKIKEMKKLRRENNFENFV